MRPGFINSFQPARDPSPPPLLPFDFIHADGGGGLSTTYLRGFRETGGTIGTASAINNLMIAVPLSVGSKDLLIKGVTLFKSAASATFKWALYEDNGSIFPGAMVQDYGEVVASVVNGRVLSAEIPVVLSSNKMYWTVIKMNAGAFIVDTQQGSGAPLGSMNIPGSIPARYNVVVPVEPYANPLPDPYPLSAVPLSTFNIHNILLGIYI